MAEEIVKENTETTVDDTGEVVTLTVDDYNRVAAELEAEKTKNAKLYARVKKAETAKPLEKVTHEPSPELSTKLTKLELQVTHGITDPEAIDFIMKNGGEEALKNPYIKKTIENMLEQKRAEAAQVAEDSQKSDFERKMTKEQMKGMSSEELEKILPHA